MRWGIEPLTPARRVAGCDFGSRRLVHAARLLGYRLRRLVDHLCLPIRFLDRRVQLAPLLRKVIRSLSESPDIDRPHDPEFGPPIAGLRRACGLRHLMQRRLEQAEVVAPRESVRYGSAIRDCRREVRLVDSGDQRFEVSSNGFQFCEKRCRIFRRLLSLLNYGACFQALAEELKPRLQLAAQCECFS